MRIRIGLAAFSLAALATVAPTGAADFACGTPPGLQCVADHLFRITKASHPDDWMRERAKIAETQIAPGSLAVAVEYFIDDNPDPSPWERVGYMARAGLIDQAVAEARRGDSPDERVGGLLAVAEQLAGAKAFDRAAALLAEAESHFASVADSNFYHNEVTAEIWARIGRFDDAVRVMPANAARAITKLLELATKYPAQAPDLRQRALVHAERDNTPFAWHLIADDAAKRGDTATTSRAAQYGLAAAPDQVSRPVTLAKALLDAGLRDEAGKAIDPWQTWAREKDRNELSGLIWHLLPILVALGRDEEIGIAANMFADTHARVRELSRASELLFRAGQPARAAKFELRAITIANEDTALHNLALARARHGYVEGALDLASRIRSQTRMKDVLGYIVRGASDAGHGAATARAVDRLADMARADRDPKSMLRAASEASRAGQNEKANDLLEEAVAIAQRAGSASNLPLGEAVELVWRLDGTTQAVLNFLSNITDPGQRSEVLLRPVMIIAPASPAAALELAGQITTPRGQVEALSRVARALLAADNKQKPN